MKFGLFGINNYCCADPSSAAKVARAAETAGFESLWAPEHVVLPDPQVPPSPLPPDAVLLETVASLSFLAGQTRTIKLGTGIIILPQRNPLVLAKQLTSIDMLSNGRLIVGIGIGYLKPEFDALGIPFDHRAERTEEYLAAMIALWTMEKPEYRGRYVSFSGINAMPRPVQKPHPQIVFGGNSKAAFSRAARLARGWYGFLQDLDAASGAIEELRGACKAAGRRFEDLEISITPGVKLDRDTVKRFSALGVHRLILLTEAQDELGLLSFIANTERELIGRS